MQTHQLLSWSIYYAVQPLFDQFPGLTLLSVRLRSASQANVARIAVSAAHDLTIFNNGCAMLTR